MNLDQNMLTFYFITTVFGLLFGSFLNVVIARLPVMLDRMWRTECALLLSTENGLPETDSAFNLFVPRSRCPHCEQQISMIDNIPLLSFILLRGQCRNCKAAISKQYPLVEAITALSLLTVAYFFGPTPEAAVYMGLTLVLIALSVIDLNHTILPDELNFPALWAGLLLSLCHLEHFPTPQDAILGAVFGYLSLWSVYWVFKLLTGKEGMGYGDFKLLAVFGAWLGWQSLPIVVLLSATAGAATGITLIALKQFTRETPMPFGPFLAAAGWLAILFQAELATFVYGAVL